MCASIAWPLVAMPRQVDGAKGGRTGVTIPTVLHILSRAQSITMWTHLQCGAHHNNYIRELLGWLQTGNDHCDGIDHPAHTDADESDDCAAI